MNNLYLNPSPLNGLSGVRRAAQPAVAKQPQPSSGGGFAQALDQAVAADREIAFSGHAQTRLRSRGLEMTPDRMARLNGGVSQAEAKGARSSLVMLDDIALVVSVRNRTVITAMDGTQLKDNVFTNIDSAVIA